MSESMVERVAKALAEQPDIGGNVWKWENLPEDHREIWLTFSRTAIAAMREPTAAVISAIAGSPGYEGNEDRAKQEWQAGVDAALSEPR